MRISAMYCKLKTPDQERLIPSTNSMIGYVTFHLPKINITESGNPGRKRKVYLMIT